MKTGAPSTAAREWQSHWPLVLGAMVGYSAIGLQSYGLSPFVADLEAAFGWTRAQAMLGVSISNAVGVLLNVIIGLVVDRFGSRRVGLLGICVITASFALLGTASGTLANWLMLWVMVAVGVVLVQSTVWTRPVANRFDQARGMAIAVSLSGTALAAMIIPLLATTYIAYFGWRHAFLAVGLTWLLIVLPIAFFCFHDRHKSDFTADAAKPSLAGAAPGLTLQEGLRTGAFWRLLISFGCFAFYSMTIGTNLVPLLSEAGTTAMGAAQIASIMGMVAIAARLSIGVLLDHAPGNLVGTGTMLMPVIGCAILLLPDPSPWMIVVAVATFGAAIGAEMDVAIYLATRHFGLKAFAALFSVVITFGALMGAMAPVIAGRLYDQSQSYTNVLWLLMGIMFVGAMAMLTMKPPTRKW